jgi:SAM-dependent methyltransferase
MREYISDSLVNSEYYSDRIAATSMGKYSTQIEGSFIEESLMLHLTKAAVIFDAGGGTGRFAIPLYRNGYRVIVEEINPLPLGILRRREPAIPVILLDSKAKHFPIKEASFDCILCIEVDSLVLLEWFFLECNRILKDNGIIIFTILNRLSYKGFYKKLILREDFSKHFWRKSHYATSFWQIKSRLRNAGFKLIRANGFHWLPVSRESNSKLVPYCAVIEKLLHLDLLPSLSPRIIIQARKIE